MALGDPFPFMNVHQWPAPQGWQCPMCHHVYSPTQPMCMYCPGTPSTSTTTLKIVDCACLPGAERTCQSSSCIRKFPPALTTVVSAGEKP